MDEWWRDDKFYLFDTLNEEWGVDTLMGRETPEGWEYAIVAHRNRHATLVRLFRNGVLLSTE